MGYNRLKVIKLIGVLALSLSMMTGCMVKKDDSSVNQSYEFQPTAVKTQEVVSDEVYDAIFTIGEIKSKQQYQANAMTSGDVLEVFFNTGEYVEKGQVLFTIETTDFEVDKSTKVTQASNALTQARLSFDTASENFVKYKSLFESGAASKTELDNVKSQMDNAKLSYNSAYQSYESVSHNYDSLSDNYTVTAPVSGVITDKNVAQGMFATTQNGFTIDVTEDYEVKTQVASKYINQVHVGQSVEVYVSTLDELIKGQVSSVSLSASNGTYPVEITLDNTSKLIKPGMFADIWIIKSSEPQGIWIPSQALLQANGESFVYVLKDDFAKKVLVEVVSLRGDDMAVRGELDTNDRLITFGKEFVMDGAPVIVND
ncbi:MULTISPECIES: efflux RND transporter periplasmic adaptor subunit [unclassified Fusibacter]|uniref:efflux RND transporter periplasmic adaptor subunit n=1 Tax=unclassified Fusibacter TaxID=2624464 RepID=UPI001010DE8B|nr:MULTISPECIES: efflux RND transporter periplasmic adaptor subunit [unclassified Fusibacter]MCK8060177.1 efflux RND transporter periplasmic adaptor subunit [Fusibacter sp. A2]NPE22317.1 efflux RND transporter periplasmic adaptor subunit [Fusibacter sp. A1]RXV61090.1 efflux RND transporter periplasmic adaptor subunit [Fusibacter sp. A1]